MLVWENVRYIPGKIYGNFHNPRLNCACIFALTEQNIAMIFTACYFYAKAHNLINKFHYKRVIRVLDIQENSVNAFCH